MDPHPSHPTSCPTSHGPTTVPMLTYASSCPGGTINRDEGSDPAGRGQDEAIGSGSIFPGRDPVSGQVPGSRLERLEPLGIDSGMRPWRGQRLQGGTWMWEPFPAAPCNELPQPQPTMGGFGVLRPKKGRLRPKKGKLRPKRGFESPKGEVEPPKGRFEPQKGEVEPQKGGLSPPKGGSVLFYGQTNPQKTHFQRFSSTSHPFPASFQQIQPISWCLPVTPSPGTGLCPSPSALLVPPHCWDWSISLLQCPPSALPVPPSVGTGPFPCPRAPVFTPVHPGTSKSIPAQCFQCSQCPAQPQSSQCLPSTPKSMFPVPPSTPQPHSPVLPVPPSC